MLLPKHRARAREPSGAVLPALPEGALVLQVNEDLVLGAFASVLIQIWRAPASVARLERVSTCYSTLLDAHAQLGMLVVMEHLAPADGPTRQKSAEMMKTYAPRVAGLAMLLEGETIKDNIVRLSLTTISLLSSTNIPQQVFSKLPDASAWLATLLPGEVTAASLIATATHLRARH